MSASNSSSVATWSLAASQPQPALKTLLIGPNAAGDETSLDDDTRTLVNPSDIKPGGKYYSVVKLQIRYEKQTSTDERWAQGSGWLITPDLLITAGHCAFDHTYGLGRASEVKAYVGYNGKASIAGPNVQFRHGARVMTTTGWIKSDVNRENDVSFIKLDQPFNNVVPFQYQPTPTRGALEIGVVGYPADKTLNDERAAQMYQQFKTVTFDLDTTALNMLEYLISTYGGQSGSPVIIKGQNSVIGTHVYGLGNKNSASVIRGKYGNFYRSYQSAISGTIPPPVAGALYSVVQVPETEDALDDAPLSETEGFWQTLKSVVNVGAKVGQQVLNIGTPFLGPVGGPIAAVAGTALGFAAKYTESSFGTESALEVDHSYQGHACRAILSEAALQAVLKMHHSKAEKYGIFEKMQKTFQQNKPYVKQTAQRLGPTIMEPALRIALHATTPAPAPTATVAYPALPAPVGTESALEPAHDDFIKGLQTAAQGKGETEGFFDFLSNVARIGVKVAPHVISAVGGIVGAIGGESAMEPVHPLGKELQPHLETLCHRTLMGDAALQAIMTIPAHELKAEGFFGDMVDTVKNLGRTVLKAAPSIIRAVEPIVHEAIQRKLNSTTDKTGTVGGGESSFSGKKPGSDEESVLDWISHTRFPPGIMPTKPTNFFNPMNNGDVKFPILNGTSPRVPVHA